MHTEQLTGSWFDLDCSLLCVVHAFGGILMLEFDTLVSLKGVSSSSSSFSSVDASAATSGYICFGSNPILGGLIQ